MPRAIWKGAISFGLVRVPVGLHPASEENDIDFDWLDKRSMDPVGYKRVNKRTGKELAKENIVKGIKRGDGEYVVLSDAEIKNAYPKTTQTIEIESFVPAGEVPFVFLERPYYLAPLSKGEKVYALLREAMLARKVIGIGRVVIHTKEHLAAVIPAGPALMLNTLRWAAEIRSAAGLEIPASGRSAAKLKESELKMAGQLIDNLTVAWKPERYADTFTDAVMELVKRKVKAGATHQVEPLETTPEESGSNVVDLTEMLKSSLGRRKAGTERRASPGTSRRRSTRRAPRRRA